MNKIDKYFTPIFLVIPVTWAGSFVAGKYVLNEINPVSMVVLRFIMSALFMLPGLALFHRLRHPDFRERAFLLHLLIAVATGGIGYHLLFFKGLEFSSPTNAALIIALNPFFTAFGEIAIFKKARPLRFYFGFLLAFSGAIWVNISRGGELNFSNFGKGELYCLLAALLWSVYTISARMTKKPHWDSLWINAYNYMFTGLLLLPFLQSISLIYDPGQISSTAWLNLLYMSFFPTVIGYTLFYIGVQKKGPAWASTFIYLVPSFTAVLDFTFFKNPLTATMILGTALVVCGLFIGNVSQKQLQWITSKYK